MKLHIKLLSALLILIIAFTAFVSCGNNSSKKPDKNDTKKKTDSSDITNNQKDDPDSIILFADGAYTAKVIMPDLATTSEKNVYNKLCSVLKEKTDVAVSPTTDFLPAGQTRDSDELAILVGNTNYDESKQATTNTEYGNYSIQIIENKVVLSFAAKDDGMELVTALESAIESDSNGQFYIPRSFSLTKQGQPQLEGLPKYATTATQVLDCTGDTSMIVANNTSLDEFKNYCAALEQSGFTLYSSRDDVNKNVFNTYTKDSLAVTAYFTPSSKSARIIAGPIDDIPTKEKDTTPETATPSLTLVSQGTRRDNGLGLVYLLPNGKFLIIDGGYSSGSSIYNLLKELAPNKDEIVITAWYISHPHGDHQRALTSFVRDYRKTVKIESVLFNYTTSEQYQAITTGPDGVNESRSFESTLTQYLDKSTKVIKPHTGQIYEYGSSKVEILYTVEDVLPTTLNYLNTSSLVVRVTVGDHSLLALADTTHVSGNILRNMYGSYLQTDAVQLAHHGIYPGYANLYETIKAKLLIWPSNLANAKTQMTDNAVIAAVNNATDVYVCNTQNITLNIPYTYVNNKQHFLDSIERS